jgi:hypothetical protein
VTGERETALDQDAHGRIVRFVISDMQN